MRKNPMDPVGLAEAVDAVMIADPVARPVVVVMQGSLQVSSHGHAVRVFRRLPDVLAGKVNDDLLLAPADPLDPFRRNKDFLARQPVTRIDDQVADRPSLVVDEEVLDVADLAVRGFHVMAAYIVRAAQVRIAMLLPGLGELAGLHAAMFKAEIHRQPVEPEVSLLELPRDRPVSYTHL